MKKFFASVRDAETKHITIIEREYDSKRDFYTDLRNNGYRVRFISTDETFDEDCEKYHERMELNRMAKNAVYASAKAHAERMGMTVVEYRAWLKN